MHCHCTHSQSEMNGEEGNTEYLSVKSLLQQWKLMHLLQHFMAQKINVDVLKMMKFQHIPELLRSFTYGDRIRFEYELEKWRYSIGNPLHSERDMHIMSMTALAPAPAPAAAPMVAPVMMSATSTISSGTSTMNSRQHFCMNNETQTNANDYSTQTQHNADDEFFNFNSVNHQPTISSSPISSPTPQSRSQPLPQPPPSPQAPQPQPSPISSSSSKITTTTTTATTETTIEPSISSGSKQIYSPRMHVSSPTLVRDPHARGRPSANFLAQQMSMRLDAREILEKCSPRGPELMRLYEMNKRFRPVERVELINLFAHYFYEHSIHLPVKLSYELERQILKLFPGERLKDYRTEKRGKIYIRLSNIKNNRRRAREAKAAFLRNLDKSDGPKESDDYTSKNSKNFDDGNNFLAEDNQILRMENSNSSNGPLEIYFKQETVDENEFMN